MSESTELALAAEANMALVNAWRARAAGSEIHGDAGLSWTFTPRPLWLPGCDRALLPPTADPQQAEQLLEAALAYFADRDVPIWCTTTARRTPAAWRASLKAAGWQYQFSGTCMAMALSEGQMAPTPTLPRGIALAELPLSNGEALLEIAAAGEAAEHPYFGDLRQDNAATEFAATLRMAERGQARIYAATDDEQWLGSVMLCTGAGAAGIYDLGVIPAARRQGIASALVLRACEAARAAGAERVTLQNGLGLIAFYERLGFRVVSTLQHWQRPAAATLPDLAERNRLRQRADFLLLENFLHHFFCGEANEAAALLHERPELAQLRQKNGATALHAVAFHGDAALARALVAAGAPLEAREADFGATPLIHATVGAGPWGPFQRRGQLDVMRLLLAAGADPQATNAWDERAAQLAPKDLPEDLRAALG